MITKQLEVAHIIASQSLTHSHQLSLPLLFTICSQISQILSSIVFLLPFGLPLWILNSHRTYLALMFVCFSFFFYKFLFLVMCARLSWPHHLAFQSTLNSRIISCSLPLPH